MRTDPPTPLSKDPPNSCAVDGQTWHHKCELSICRDLEGLVMKKPRLAQVDWPGVPVVRLDQVAAVKMLLALSASNTKAKIGILTERMEGERNLDCLFP